MRQGSRNIFPAWVARTLPLSVVYNSRPSGNLTLTGHLNNITQQTQPQGALPLTGTVADTLTISGGATVAPTGTLPLTGTLTQEPLQLAWQPAGTIPLTGRLYANLTISRQPSGTLLLQSGGLQTSITINSRPSGNLTLTGTLSDYTLQSRQITVREKPPLHLSVLVQTPSGVTARWGQDDPSPANNPAAITFTTSMPGGFQDANLTLQRDPRQTYPDLELLSTLTIIGPGGQVAWQGRIEDLPDVAGDQAQINPQCAGWQNHLSDDDSARELFVDLSISNWQGPSLTRQIQWLQDPSGAVVASGPSVAPDYTNGYPSLDCQLQGSWSQSQVVEGWYDAKGIPLGLLYAAWETNGAFALTGGNQFGAGMFLCTDDTGVVYDEYNPIAQSPGSYVLYATQSNRPWALVQLWNDTVPGGQDGVNYDLFWTALAVYGNHGLPLQGAVGPTSSWGLLASDCIAYAISRWAPKITFTTGPGGSLQPSTFILPQLVFLDPTTVAAMIQQAVSYELLDWAVWEQPAGIWPCDPCFYLNVRGQRARYWRARSGPAQLQDTGAQITNLYNGVIVQWTDVTGVTRTVGPPGSDANYTSSQLVDLTAQNAANQAGVRRWGLVTMGTSTLAGATQIGSVFLAQQRLLNSSGQATLTGYVQDSMGLDWPAWMVRAGDYITFVDSSSPTPRRIVSTSYDDSQKTNTLQLDQPPDALDALLARMSVSLTPIGLS